MAHMTLRIVLITFLMGMVVIGYTSFPETEWIKAWFGEMQTQWSSSNFFILGGVIYIILLSLPFIPGVELGLLLMCLIGKEGIFFVYLCTIIGLHVSFAMGRFLPEAWISSWVKSLGVASSCSTNLNWMKSMLNHSPLGNRFNHKLGKHLTKYRYFALALLFNLPGNFIFGGGGGIALISGMNRRFVSWKGFFCTVSIATAPVPALAYIGLIQIENFL